MSSETGHFPNRAYFDQSSGNLHLNGATLFVSSGSLIDADDGTAITLNQLLAETFADSLTAASGSQAGALALTADINRVTTCAAGNGVALPTAVPGLTIIVINHAANPLTVYGNNAAGDTINDVATGTGVVQMVSSIVFYTCTVATKWYTEGLGSGYSGSFPTSSYTDAITASSTHSIGGGTPLTTVINRVTTAGANDAVTLPIAAPGMQLTVINGTTGGGANTINIYPGQAGDQINALGAGTSMTLATAKVLNFFCTVAGQWHTILTA